MTKNKNTATKNNTGHTYRLTNNTRITARKAISESYFNNNKLTKWEFQKVEKVVTEIGVVMEQFPTNRKKLEQEIAKLLRANFTVQYNKHYNSDNGSYAVWASESCANRILSGVEREQ